MFNIIGCRDVFFKFLRRKEEMHKVRSVLEETSHKNERRIR